MKIFSQLIKPGDLCFDIGANNGNKTEEMLSLGASVVCLEPQNSCVNNLRNKFKDNPNVTIVQKAVGSEVGIGKIFISQAHTLSTMSENFISETSKERFAGVNWDNTQDVEITTMDHLISSYGIPKFCKIDVEGFESEVLKGLHQTIPVLSLEFTPELKEKTFECMNILKSLGSYKYNYSEGETYEYTFSQWISYEEMVDFLSKNNDFKTSFGDLYAKLD